MYGMYGTAMGTLARARQTLGMIRKKGESDEQLFKA
jgi:hypothetical protein